MIHAMIYDRASTKNQKDNYSRVNAREAGIKIAEQNGFTWEYIKEVGSGTTLTGRPEMMRILDRIAAGEIQVIIVQDLDRLARPEEAVVYSTIRETIMTYGVIIHTHTARIDLNDDSDDFTSDILMSVAKKERRTILKRMKRSKQAKAEQGGFTGGYPGMGYKLVYQNGKDGRLIIDDNEAKKVKIIFDTLEAAGGNIGAAVKELNAMGYTGKKGGEFAPHSLKHIATRKIYIGIIENAFTDKIIHRPDLQIISVAQFKRVQELIKNRAGNKKNLGRRGHYIFTGFLACGNCGGSMVAGNQKGKVIVYQCAARRLFYGKSGCSSGKCYTEHLVLPPVIDFMSDFIQKEINFRAAAVAAASQYGKSITEEAIEVAVTGELASVQAGKQRIIEAISLGILTTQEAAAKLAELREQEQRLTVELSSIAQKAVMMEEWQAALDALAGKDITARLYELAKEQPIVFRRILELIFEPNSLRLKTKRAGGKWVSVLEEYKLTEAMQNSSVSFVQDTKVEIYY